MSTVDVQLDISGMTCGACAARIERTLNGLPGVQARVSFATERAKVRSEEASTEDLIAAVEAAGYTAVVAAPPRRKTVKASDPERTGLRIRMLDSVMPGRRPQRSG